MKLNKDLLMGMADWLVAVGFLGVISMAVLAHMHVVRLPTKARALHIRAVNNLARPFPAKELSFFVSSISTNSSSSVNPR